MPTSTDSSAIWYSILFSLLLIYLKLLTYRYERNRYNYSFHIPISLKDSKIRWGTSTLDIIRPQLALGTNGLANDAMKHDEYRQRQEGWRDIRCALQLAKHTIVHGMLESQEMPIVMNMMLAILTMNGSISPLRFPMVVKRNRYHHWHIYQQQEPSYSESFMSEMLSKHVFILLREQS